MWPGETDIDVGLRRWSGRHLPADQSLSHRCREVRLFRTVNEWWVVGGEGIREHRVMELCGLAEFAGKLKVGEAAMGEQKA